MIYTLLTKLVYVSMDLDSVSAHKKAKKERSQYPAILAEQAWSVKDFIVWPKDYTKEFRFCGNKVLRGKEGSILPVWVANQNTGFASSCPLVEPAI